MGRISSDLNVCCRTHCGIELSRRARESQTSTVDGRFTDGLSKVLFEVLPVDEVLVFPKRTLRTILQVGNTLINDWREQAPAAEAAEMLF